MKERNAQKKTPTIFIIATHMYAYIAFLYNNTDTQPNDPIFLEALLGDTSFGHGKYFLYYFFAYLHSLGIFTTHLSMRHDAILGILLYSRACTLQDLALTKIFLKNHTTHNATQCKYQMFDIRY